MEKPDENNKKIRSALECKEKLIKQLRTTWEQLHVSAFMKVILKMIKEELQTKKSWQSITVI